MKSRGERHRCPRGTKGLQLGGQEPAVQPWCANLEYDSPRVGEEAGEGDLQARVAGEEDPLPPYAVPQETQILPHRSSPLYLAGPRPGFLRNVLNETCRAVDSDRHESLDHCGPASLGDRCR